jgi:F-type H+-transporting ATPase subunit delta
LLASAKEADCLVNVHESFEGFIEIWETDKNLSPLILAPFIINKEKHKIINLILKDKTEQIFLNFIKVVIDHNRMHFIKRIHQKFEELYLDDQGILKAIITSAIPLPKTEIEKIQTSLKDKHNKKVKVITRVDKRLVGGVIVQVGDDVVDLSLGRQLREMRNQLLEVQWQSINK